ncbi:efflux RND transporter periplasmic adaptor subunit [Pedobacter flavus]|uniref:Efflux RND transporter periplasmic adaptor subunit n=1 Tax=Pedobacter flavus TaxID=3113906 RepID=A0ABU7H2H7_9SPHI|nr:efflux RND transporter periplasmic adaptor subunit [Pedobacter sp. VNH31]MEE1885514.1 efflux RND transporter periplasmic adaptor subunit [Pedobacter sp. VNH31]
MKIQFNRNIFKIYCALFIIGTSVLACSGNKEEQTEKATPTNENEVTLTDIQIKNAGISTGNIEVKEVNSVLKLNGKIDVPPRNIISITVPLGGYVKAYNLLPGSKVTRGQVLATVEDQQYIQMQQDYLMNKAKLGFAAKEKERQQMLNAGKASSDKSLQLAESEYSSIKIALSAMGEKLKLIGIDPNKLTEQNITRQISVRSPINGYVTKVNSNIGSFVSPSDVLFELVNPSNIHLSLVVFEKDLSKIFIGQKGIAYSNNDPSKKYNTKIELINTSLGEDRSVEVHSHFINADKTLIPGMYMNAEIILNDASAKTLPENSIVSFEGKPYVFIEKAKNTYVMTPVEIGESDNGFIPVYTDLGNQKIVIKGAYSILMQLKNIVEEE